MPYDEFDLDDPLELVAQEVSLEEEHLNEMAECFVEEFARMGYGAEELFKLFCDPFYRGPYSVLQARGEKFVRDLIEERVGARPTAAVRRPDLVQLQFAPAAYQE